MKKYLFFCAAILLFAPYLHAQKEYLARINPATGTYSTVDSITGVVSIAAQASAYNETGHQMIFNGVDNTNASRLYSVNTTGALANDPTIVLSGAGDNLTELRYDNSTSTLYGLNWVSGSTQEYFVSINASTGAYSSLAAVSGVQSITAGASALDVTGGHFIFIGQDNSHASSVYTLNVTNGSVVSSPALSGDANNIIELRYENSSNTLYGLYMPAGGTTEHFASIDVTSGAMTDIATLTGVQWVNTNTAALDGTNHRYMFVGQDASYQTHLYSVNTATGAIASSPVLTDSAAGMTDLHYDNSASTLYGLLWGSAKATGVDEPVPSPGTYRINGYPNPTSSQATLQLNKMYPNVSVTITNSLGEVMRTDAFQNASEVTIKRGELPAGAYILSVVADKIPVGVMKLVVID